MSKRNLEVTNTRDPNKSMNAFSFVSQQFQISIFYRNAFSFVLNPNLLVCAVLLSYCAEFKTNLQEMQRQAVDNSKGLMSWFTADKGPPPLIPSTHLAVSFWASWFLLAIESQSYSVFYQHVFEALFKKDKTTLDQAVRVS